MARPTTIHDDDLLAAARAVLRERGAATTTAEVAQRAGVSEGTLFHRFGSKNALFREAMQGIRPAWIDGLEARVGRGDVYAQLDEVSHEVLAFYDELMPSMIFMVGSDHHEAGHQRAMGHAISGKQNGERRFAEYLEAEMRLGRLARHDAEVVAMSILGALHSYAFNAFMLRGRGELVVPAHTFVRGLLRLLRAGLDAEPRAPSEPAATDERARKRPPRKRRESA